MVHIYIFLAVWFFHKIPMSIRMDYIAQNSIGWGKECSTSHILPSTASYYLPDEGFVIITEKIIANNQYVKLCLTSVNENSTRIISFQSYYVMCNLSKYQLSFYAFCIHRSEKFTHNDIVKLLTERASSISMVTNHRTVDNIVDWKIDSNFFSSRSWVIVVYFIFILW